MRGFCAAQVLIRRFEIAARPAHTNDSALLGQGPIQESECSARAFQQGFGDKKA